jgi:hypothetical protein
MIDLAKLDRAVRYLAELTDPAEVKKFRDDAKIAGELARVRQLGLEAQNHANEIRLRADRRLGQLLIEISIKVGQPPGSNGRNARPFTVGRPTLATLNLTKTDSSHSQQIAKIDEAIFERYLSETRAAGRELNTSGLLEVARALRPSRPVPPPGSSPLSPRPLPRFCPPDWTSAEIVAKILRTFFPLAVTCLDPCYGLGNFWDGTAHVTVTAHDSQAQRAPNGIVDATALPYPADGFDVVVIDPPQFMDGGATAYMTRRYTTLAGHKLKTLVRNMALESWRVGKYGCVIKVADYTHGGLFIRQTAWVRAALQQDEFDVVHQTRIAPLVDDRPEEERYSALNNGSTYLIYRKGDQHHRAQKGVIGAVKNAFIQ